MLRHCLGGQFIDAGGGQSPTFRDRAKIREKARHAPVAVEEGVDVYSFEAFFLAHLKDGIEVCVV